MPTPTKKNKLKRCPNGTKRNPKTGLCEKENKKNYLINPNANIHNNATPTIV